MARQTKPRQTSRIRHSAEYKAEALKVAERLGVGAAAPRLGLHESQICAWRSRARQKESSGDAERRQATDPAQTLEPVWAFSADDIAMPHNNKSSDRQTAFACCWLR